MIGLSWRVGQCIPANYAIHALKGTSLPLDLHSSLSPEQSGLRFFIFNSTKFRLTLACLYSILLPCDRIKSTVYGETHNTAVTEPACASL